MFRVGFDQRQHRLLLPSLRRVNLDSAATFFREVLLKVFKIFEGGRHVDQAGNVLLIQIDLFEQRLEELCRMEIGLVFPEELPAVNDVPAAQVKQVNRDQRRLGVVSEDVG